MPKFILTIVTTICTLLLSNSLLQADSLYWHWSYQTVDIEDDTSFVGQGTLTTESTITTLPDVFYEDTTIPFAGYLITAISGTINGQTITGLEAPGGLGGNDNILSLPTEQLDYLGFSFDTAEGTYNIYYEFDGYTAYDGTNSDFDGNFSAYVVPETSQYGWCVALVFASFLGWRRFSTCPPTLAQA